MTKSSHKNLVTASDILRRGATLLADPCPKCQGVQIKYRDKVTCINCGDLMSMSTTDSIKPESVRQNLRELAQEKMIGLSDLLRKESSLENQKSLLELIMLYLELYEKTKEPSENKSNLKTSRERNTFQNK